MMKRIAAFFLTALLLLLLPACEYEDNLDNIFDRGYESGYSEGYSDGYNEAEGQFGGIYDQGYSDALYDLENGVQYDNPYWD